MEVPILKCVLALCFMFPAAGSYKILAFHAFASKSHLNAFLPVVNELANRGHEVTILQPYRDLKLHPKINIKISVDADVMKEENSKKMFEDDKNLLGILGFLKEFTIMAESVCRTVLTSDTVKSLVKEGKQYDIVIVNYILNECGMAVAPLLGKYVVYFSAGSIPDFFRSPAPLPYAAIPSHFSPLPSRMSFTERFTNIVFYLTLDVWYYYHLIPATEKVLAEVLPQAPSVLSGMNQISLYMTNIDPVMVVPRPRVPNIVALCCPHCKPAKRLPKDLETFVNSSGDDGFIIFGLGSFAQSKNFPQRIKEAFLSAFGKLKQKVIWKFEDDSLKTPPNVFITSWMPQQDLLGHPKIRLFITHGGLLSLQEAAYNAVPMIGIPLFADQPGNVAYLVERGIGGRLDVTNLTAEHIYEEITKVIKNPGYAEKMKKYSAIMKDHNKGTISQGADWIEYVAKHEGAWHLRTLGQDMNSFEYFLIDIILFVAGILIVTVLIIMLPFKLARRKLRCSKQKKSKTN